MHIWLTGPTIDFDSKGMAIRSATELRNAWSQNGSRRKCKPRINVSGNAEIASKLLDDALGTEICRRTHKRASKRYFTQIK